MSERQLVSPALAGESPERAAALQGSERQRLGLSFVLTHGLALTLVLTALLGFWRLDQYPRTWFDEGSYSEVAGNIAERGDYFAQAPDGTREFAPVIAVGPTVLLPAAMAQATLGSTLMAGRLVGALYLLLATGAVYLLARRLFGEREALVAVAVLLSMPALDWLGTGRQLLGEASALFFLLVGVGCAFRGRGFRFAALGGVFFGLAMITKGQYLLILPPVIALVTVFDALTARVRPLRWYAALAGTAIAAYAAWFVVLLSLIGEGSLVENYRLLRDASDGALFVLNFDRMRSAVALLLGPRTLFLIPPSIVYGIYLIRREVNPARRLALISMATFQVCWFAWFAFASIAWPRYAFPALALSTLFAGALVVNLYDTLRVWLLERQPTKRVEAGAAVLALGAIGLLMAAGAYRQIAPVFVVDESEPQHFAAKVDQTVPSGAVIDGWEPEINFLSERAMQYPPTGSLDRVVRSAWLGSSEDVDLSGSLRAEYLVVGHFGRWVGVYETALASGQYRLILSQDGYELYERLGAP